MHSGPDCPLVGTFLSISSQFWIESEV
jgi:hypothetical protein